MALLAVASRTLKEADLGRVTVALSTAALVALFAGLSSRRLVFDREPEAGLLDLRFAVLAFGLLGALVTGGICWSLFDLRAGAVGVQIGLWRAADAYGDIGQGIFCRAGRFDRAGVWMGLRTGLPTALTVLMLANTDLVAALAAGTVVRVLAAIAESHVGDQSTFKFSSWLALRGSLTLGWYLGLVGGLIILVDTGPTLALAQFASLEQAALLAPLGRLRFALTIVATTMGEVYYAEMIRQRYDFRRVFALSRLAVQQYLVPAAVLTIATAIGLGRLVFGPILVNHAGLIVLAMGSGTAMGATTLVSQGFTAQNKLGIQLWAFAFAAVIAVGGAAAGHWSVEGMYLSQSLGCVAASVVLVIAALRSGRNQEPVSVRPPGQV
jgi:O-antigen/teichoic acid export membrane protein